MLEQRIEQQFIDSADLKYQAAEHMSKPIAEAVQALMACVTNGGKVLACGNGGSAGERRCRDRRAKRPRTWSAADPPRGAGAVFDAARPSAANLRPVRHSTTTAAPREVSDRAAAHRRARPAGRREGRPLVRRLIRPSVLWLAVLLLPLGAGAGVAARCRRSSTPAQAGEKVFIVSSEPLMVRKVDNASTFYVREDWIKTTKGRPRIVE